MVFDHSIRTVVRQWYSSHGILGYQNYHIVSKRLKLWCVRITINFHVVNIAAMALAAQLGDRENVLLLIGDVGRVVNRVVVSKFSRRSVKLVTCTAPRLSGALLTIYARRRRRRLPFPVAKSIRSSISTSPQRTSRRRLPASSSAARTDWLVFLVVCPPRHRLYRRLSSCQ